MNVGQTSELEDSKVREEAEYAPLGQRIGSRTGWYRRPQPEPAIRETVDAQLDGLRQHVDDASKLITAEVGGQIELLRREIGDLRGTRQRGDQRKWDLWKIALNGLILIVAAAVGALAMWLLTRNGS